MIVEISEGVFLTGSMIAFHEIGHYVAARFFKVRSEFGIVKNPWPYPVVRTWLPDGFSAWKHIVIALFGPLFSVLFEIFLLVFNLQTYGIVSIFLGVFSLIPIGEQDGCHILEAIRR